MALDKQISLYSVDTNAFLSENELKIKEKLVCLQKDRYMLENEIKHNTYLISCLKQLYKKVIDEESDTHEYECSILSRIYYLEEQNELDTGIIHLINAEIKWRKPLVKEELLLEMMRTVTLNKMRDEANWTVRKLDNSYIYKTNYIVDEESDELQCESDVDIETDNDITNDVELIEDINIRNVVSMFSSTLSRTFEIQTNELTKDIIVVEIYYFDILQDLILHNFMFNNDKYIYFSSSAGQIRTKKAVFVKESTYKKHELQLMCGLTIDKINSLGGMNVNKFLAYFCLNNSATDRWEDVFIKDFDIDRCIVVNDFETLVPCVVDYIDYQTYEITPNVEKDIPIPHTDGCGMILPSYCAKNFMVRLPWIKGLLGSFDFLRFIEENKCQSKVFDIWGKEYDVIEDNIQIIFTKSQLKMYKFYSSWKEYKDYFKQYKCEACICNMEEDKIPNAKINYQMLQTLYDMTDDEIKDICSLSNKNLEELTSSLKNILSVYGVKDTNKSKKKNSSASYFQDALEIYPELLNDTATKDDIRELKNSLVKQYKSGKLDVIGKFTFILPDFYAFCQYLFQGIDTPIGLLSNKEVYCRLYKNSRELDCLRSPHLYIEHAVRTNVCDKVAIINDKEIKLSDWFNTDAIYASTHDLISRILQYDVDGDRLLVLAQKNIIKIAKRCMKNVNPLFYEMKKANSQIIDNQCKYNGLRLAFVGGNIGVISNDISKIWNNPRGIGQNEINAVKWLCMENNFVID